MIYRFQNKRHKLLNLNFHVLGNRYTVGEYESRSVLTSCYKERAQSYHLTCAKWMILWGHRQTKNLIHTQPLNTHNTCSPIICSYIFILSLLFKRLISKQVGKAAKVTLRQIRALKSKRRLYVGPKWRHQYTAVQTAYDFRLQEIYSRAKMTNPLH